MKFGTRRAVSAGFILIASAGVWYALSVGGNIRGDLTGQRDVNMRIKEFADTNHDRVLSAREIRKALAAVLRGVIGRNTSFDVTNDGAVDRSDTRESLRVFRLLLAAVCGNGTINAGEACDDGNAGAGDGCDATCTVESGYACNGQPSVCTPSTGPAVCGNGTVEAGEECDDGNLVSGDFCSGTDHPNGSCTVEFCGDGFVNRNGIFDDETGEMFDMPEWCDEGGVCIGGLHDGERCTHFGYDTEACGANIPCLTQDSATCFSTCRLP